MTGDRMKMDSGYTKAGTHWEIGRYKLRHANVFYVNVNGKSTMFSKRNDCYEHLIQNKITAFRKVVSSKGTSYEHVPESVGGGDGNTDGGTDIQSNDAE